MVALNSMILERYLEFLKCWSLVLSEKADFELSDSVTSNQWSVELEKVNAEIFLISNALKQDRFYLVTSSEYANLI